jgi:hypothetical protein
MRRHPLDPFSLVFGIMFAGLGGLLLNTEIDVADFSGRWLLPLPLLFVGFLFVAFGLNRLRRSREVAAADDSEDTIEDSVVE